MTTLPGECHGEIGVMTDLHLYDKREVRNTRRTCPLPILNNYTQYRVVQDGNMQVDYLPKPANQLVGKMGYGTCVSHMG